MVVSKKDKMILQLIFLIGQAGVFLEWFGWPNINTCIGLKTIFFGNILYIIGWGLYLYAVWWDKATLKVKFLPLIYGVFFAAAASAIYLWWRGTSFFIGGDIQFEMRYILPGYYWYMGMMLVSFIVHELYLRRIKLRIGMLLLLALFFIAVSTFLPYHIVDDTDNVQNVRLTYYGETIEEHKEVLCDEESVQELLTIVSDMKCRRTLDTFNQVNPDRITPNQIEIDLLLNGKSHHIVLNDKSYYYSSGENFSRRKIVNAEDMLVNVQAIIDKNEAEDCGE